MYDFLACHEDIAWLQEAHGIPTNGYACAEVFGNLDCPSKVRLFARNHIDCKPTVYRRDEDGNLVITQHGEPTRKDGQ